MPPTRDHKRIGDGDTGPNTGGMGAVTDSSLLSPDQLTAIVDTIVRPTLHGCVKEGLAFNGILFVGLMLTAEGPKVLEYNLRFGDPETQAILVRLETDLVDVCEAMLTGRLNGMEIKWTAGSSACIVLAAEGYPDKPRTGDVIQGLDEVENATVFHAGTAKDQNGDIVTAGGRVLGVTTTGADLIIDPQFSIRGRRENSLAGNAIQKRYRKVEPLVSKNSFGFPVKIVSFRSKAMSPGKNPPSRRYLSAGLTSDSQQIFAIHSGHASTGRESVSAS